MGGAASSVPVAGGAGWVTSVGVAPGPSGGGVGKALVDMVNVDDYMGKTRFCGGRVSD